MLDINAVLRAAPDCKTVIEGFARFLGVDCEDSAYLIRLDIFNTKGQISPKAPFSVSMGELSKEIRDGKILLGHEFDCGLPKCIEILKENAKHEIARRASILRPLLDNEDTLYNARIRGSLFQKIEEDLGIGRRQIRRYYYIYLWGGQSNLALAPRYEKRGGLGKIQKKKTGRRGRKSNEENCSNFVLPDRRNELEKGARLFYLNGKRTLKSAFVKTLEKYFSNGTRLEKTKENDAPLKEILLPPDQLPTFRQFRYVCECIERKEGKRKAVPQRIRQKDPDWEFRGTNRDNVPGPGYRFEIDATKVQIRLVSQFDRSKTLRDATLYVLIDVWSGAIVGYSLSLENASWALAAKALYNCISQKDEVFNRLGLAYCNDDWPCHHMPTKLAADRAELVSNKAGCVCELGITVEIMPPMCPELKGAVEARFKDVKHRHGYDLPGKHPKGRKRRETDGTNTAALTFRELEIIIVEIIMGLNHEPVPDNAIPFELLEEELPDITHIDVYRWGLKNRPGFTRTLPTNEIYTHLLTKAMANHTARGITFKGQTYRGDGVELAQKGRRPNGRAGFVTPIRYDESRADKILFLNKDNVWTEAHNTNQDMQRRKESFYELEFLRRKIKELRDGTKDESLYREIVREEKIKEIIDNAKKEAKEDCRGTSVASRKKNRNEHTELEKNAIKIFSSYPVPPSDAEVAKLASPQKSKSENTTPKKISENKPSISERSKELWED